MNTKEATLGTILYIDDEPLNLRLIQKSLTRMGYKVLGELDAKLGLETARHSRPDVILLDMHMPGMSGLEAIELLKADKETSEMPIVALTADTREELRTRCMGAGCEAYLNKPISRSLLLKVVGQLINGNAIA